MLKLLPNDIISACELPTDDDSACCLFCAGPTYRVAAVRSAAGAHRRAPLCANHFVETAIAFPRLFELERFSAC